MCPFFFSFGQRVVEDVLDRLGQVIGELDVQRDEQVAALRRLLGQRQAVAGYPLDRRRLGHFVDEVDVHLLARQSRYLHHRAAQRLHSPTTETHQPNSPHLDSTNIEPRKMRRVGTEKHPVMSNTQSFVKHIQVQERNWAT